MVNKMKINVCALAIMACAAHSVMAADSVDVKVIGTIAPAACTPVLSGGGVIDYGDIKANTLSATNYTLLDAKSVDLSISCDAPTSVAVKGIDGRNGSLAGATEGAGGGAASPVSGISSSVVGLGLADGAKIGGYGVAFISAQADGVAVSNLTRAQNASTWSVPSVVSGLYGTTQPIYATWGNSTTKTPVSFKNLSTSVVVRAYLNKSSELDLTKQIKLDGLSTIELVYL